MAMTMLRMGMQSLPLRWVVLLRGREVGLDLFCARQGKGAVQDVVGPASNTVLLKRAQPSGLLCGCPAGRACAGQQHAAG